MDDITHNCPRCHEITRDPDDHACGLNPVGGLPANQPHKAPESAFASDFARRAEHRLAS